MIFIAIIPTLMSTSLLEGKDIDIEMISYFSLSQMCKCWAAICHYSVVNTFIWSRYLLAIANGNLKMHKLDTVGLL